MYEYTHDRLNSSVTRLAAAPTNGPHCPACTAPIEGFTTDRPGRHTVVPCGCELGFVRASDLEQEATADE
ncbi:hypothetical protein ELS19_04095 [Halogeometricum borinquense]|uniref:Uncharacterized protein n=2 Tax=Halogeometricum borinquense TaxID=60847 RepID=A0A482TQZ0_9EURY|nr:hypothetical protein ELS19_04095 [Halogeometricum borinquense]